MALGGLTDTFPLMSGDAFIDLDHHDSWPDLARRDDFEQARRAA
jgi:hypothetical protein